MTFEQALEEIQTSTRGSPEFMMSLVSMYLEQAEQVRCLIGAAQPDRPEAAKAAHSFAGASLTLGMDGVAERALELERALADESETSEDRRQFIQLVEEATSLLEDWVQSLD